LRAAPSIKRRLLLGLLAAILLAWGVALYLSYRDARHELHELLDAYLAQSTSLLIAQLGHEDDEIDTEHVPMLHRYSRVVAFQVWEEGRRLRLHSPAAPDRHLSERLEGYSDSVVAGEAWRVFSAWDTSHAYLVQVGERRAVRDNLTWEIARNLLAPLLLTFPVLGLVIWLGVSRGLRPLTALRREVEVRDPDNLVPLATTRVPVEVAPLAQALNRLFERVRALFENERRFTADAAHELRTPLAAIKTQAQVARAAASDEERRHALDQVLAGCDRATHLVAQLLTLARLEPGQSLRRAPCALRALSASVIADLAPGAVQKGVQLQLRDGDEVVIHGDADLLRILLRNLVDNAIRYSPPAGDVHVSVAAVDGKAVIAVCDQGPGIPAEVRSLVWGRFYRVLGSGETGSGLGLSIVKRIAELHAADATLSDAEAGRGLCVTVRFPQAGVPAVAEAGP
jgi:two-component system sensor histidine kinase QseC